MLIFFKVPLSKQSPDLLADPLNSQVVAHGLAGAAMTGR